MPKSDGDLDRPDIEAYVGMGLRAMARSLHPVVCAILPQDERLADGDQYEILRCVVDKRNRGAFSPMHEPSVLGAAYRALELRNRFAHPKVHSPLEPGDAIAGLDAMRILVTAFAGSVDEITAIRDAISTITELPSGLLLLTTSENEDHTGLLEDSAGIKDAEISARMTLRPQTDAAYRAAEVIRTAAFETDGSVFGAGSVWTVENLEQLDHRLVDEPGGTLSDFVVVYVRQLRDARDDLIQLAGEVLYVHLWINAKSISGARKRDAVQRIVGLRSDPVAIGSPMSESLDMGLVRTGPAFHQRRWDYVRVIVDSGQRLRRCPPSEREAFLEDPWRFRDWILRDSGGALQRHALMHLLFPDTFEAIVAEDHKQQILERLGGRLPQRTGNTDRDLYELRRLLASEYGPRYDYYRPPVSQLWM